MLHMSVLMLLVAPIPPAIGAQWAMSALADRDYVVMSGFLTAVDAYIVEHHRLDEPLSEDMTCLPEDTLSKINVLAEVPREDRRPPKEGELFTREVADLFRRLLRMTFAGEESNTGDLIARVDKEALCAPPLRVNEPPPRGIGHTLMSPVVNGLPPLPDELEYRVVGHDLLLVDVRSNLVVDVIRAALSMF
jgi:hypothetical protein